MAALAAVHGLYFGLTGIWPIVHMRSFLAVTGPKHDLWLVRRRRGRAGARGRLGAGQGRAMTYRMPGTFLLAWHIGCIDFRQGGKNHGTT